MGNDIVLTCIRDEEDIIEIFVRYYLAVGFDAVHVIDNGSSDRGVERVRALAAAGLAVDVESDPRDGYERYLTDWFRATGARYEPRWLFFLDCDEFIVFPGSAKSYLNSLPAECNRLRLRQKEIYPSDPPDRRPGGFLLSRRAEPRFNETTKDIVRWSSDAVVFGGKHRIDVPSPVTMQADDIFIRHYKYRTPEQALRKEINRVAVEGLYSDAELERISAFGVDAARDWVDYCRGALQAGRWRESFALDREAMDDPEMRRLITSVMPDLIEPRKELK